MWNGLGPTADRSSQHRQTASLRAALHCHFTISIYDFGESKIRNARELILRPRTGWRSVRSMQGRKRAKPICGCRANMILRAIIRSACCLCVRRSSTNRRCNITAVSADIPQLILDARDRIASSIAALNARRDFFIAESDLKAALATVLMRRPSPKSCRHRRLLTLRLVSRSPTHYNSSTPANARGLLSAQQSSIRTAAIVAAGTGRGS